MRGYFDSFAFLGTLTLGLAFVLLARWRMQVIYVRNGGVLTDASEQLPKQSLGRMVVNSVAGLAFLAVFWATSFELAHLGVAAIVVWLGSWAWRMANVFNVRSATVPERLGVAVLVVMGVLSIAYSMHVFLRGWYGAV